VLLFLEWFTRFATHHSVALQSVVFVWDLNCMLRIPEFDDTGFKNSGCGEVVGH
jgi:hypothetical protein